VALAGRFLFCATAATGSSSWHGRNVGALEESLRDGDINGVEPPFRVVVAGAPRDMEEFLSKLTAVLSHGPCYAMTRALSSIQ
jgi:hypothetical protein